MGKPITVTAPAAFRNLDKLTELRMENNDFKGVLPSMLGFSRRYHKSGVIQATLHSSLE